MCEVSAVQTMQRDTQPLQDSGYMFVYLPTRAKTSSIDTQFRALLPGEKPDQILTSPHNRNPHISSFLK